MPIYKGEKRGTYYVKMQIEMPDGTKKQHKKTGFKSSKEAKDYEASMIAGTKEYQSNMTFESIANKYLEWYQTRRKESSVAKVSAILKTYLIPYFGKKKISNIKSADIITWQDYMMKTEFPDRWGKKHSKLANDTLLAIHTRLSAVFNFGIKHYDLKMNPAAVVGNFEVKPVKRLDFWQVHEFEEFYKVIDNEKYKIAFLLLFYGGFRKGELLAIQWKDIDREKNRIHINASRGKTGVGETKTESSTRYVPINESLINFIFEYKKKVAPQGRYDDCYILSESGPTPLSPTQLDRMYDKYIEKSKVRRITIHEFRHSHASYLINNGCSIRVVADRLGHKDVAETLNTYSHLYPDSQDEILKIIERDIKL